jgi:adenosylhomocysteine nucleosidase
MFRARPATTFVIMVALCLVAIPSIARGPIAVQGAVDGELGPLLDAIGNPEPRVLNGYSFWEGTIGGERVVISRTEVGMVHAAIATTLLVKEYGPRLIINQGTAGAANPALKVGDIVLGKASTFYGSVRTQSRRRGEGVDLTSWEILPRLMRIDGERVRFDRFEADEELLGTAVAAPYDGGRLVMGIVGSGDQWNRELDKLLWAHETFGIESEDMESASAHQTAYVFGIPFLAIRIISNSEFNDPEFRASLGTNCAQFVVRVVRALAGVSPSP